MARETKIGLLSGLAFIICFAIILANRGSQPSLPVRQPYLVDHDAGVRHIAQGHEGTPAPALREPRAKDRDSRHAQTPTTPSVQRPLPTRVDRSADGADGDAEDNAATSGANVVMYDQTAPASGWSRSGSGTTSTPQHAAADLSALHAEGYASEAHPGQLDATGDRALTSRSQDQAERRRILEQMLNGGTGGTPEAGETPRHLPAEPAETLDDHHSVSSGESTSNSAYTPTGTVARPVRYTIMPGDRLYEIAAKHYGRPSARVVDAIFNTNRSVLSSPDALRVGVELTLPVVEGIGSPTGGSSAAARERSMAPTVRTASDAESAQLPFRWYQVRKNDRYMSIAREQLGDANRWREIFELNKDKFPNPQLIREGVRIKLPASGVASAGERRP